MPGLRDAQHSCAAHSEVAGHQLLAMLKAGTDLAPQTVWSCGANCFSLHSLLRISVAFFAFGDYSVFFSFSLVFTCGPIHKTLVELTLQTFFTVTDYKKIFQKDK